MISCKSLISFIFNWLPIRLKIKKLTITEDAISKIRPIGLEGQIITDLTRIILAPEKSPVINNFMISILQLNIGIPEILLFK